MSKLFIALIPALWVVIMAIVSVQNATPVSLRFFWAESVEMPFGVVLGFSFAIGMVVTTAIMLLLGETFKPSR